MTKCNELKEKSQVYLALQGARRNFVARIVMAVIVVRSVTVRGVASVHNPSVLMASNEQRIKRFVGEVSFESKLFAKLMRALLPIKTGRVITLERTNWQLGSRTINILMLGVAYKGVAFRILWALVDKQGNSDTPARLALRDRRLSVLAAEPIDSVVAEREFIGADGFKGLKARGLLFVMRVRNSLSGSKGSTRPASVRYARLKPGEV